MEDDFRDLSSYNQHTPASDRGPHVKKKKKEYKKI